MPLGLWPCAGTRVHRKDLWLDAIWFRPYMHSNIKLKQRGHCRAVLKGKAVAFLLRMVASSDLHPKLCRMRAREDVPTPFPERKPSKVTASGSKDKTTLITTYCN